MGNEGSFSCGACGKTYKWKAQLAGKRAKCKCGHVITVPRSPPADDSLDDLYALADDATSRRHEAVADGVRCPSCGVSMTPGISRCASCSFDLKTGRPSAAPQAAPIAAIALTGAGEATSPILAYGGTAPKRVGKDDVGDNKLIEYYIPLGLITFGLLIAVLQNMRFSTVPLAFGAAMVAVIVGTIVNLVLMLVACLIAVKLIDVSFGAPGPALLKLAAISLAPGAIATTIRYFMPGTTGWFIAWVVALILYCGLFSYLFDLDGGEVMILAVIVWLIRVFVGVFIVVALLTLVLGH